MGPWKRTNAVSANNSQDYLPTVFAIGAQHKQYIALGSAAHCRAPISRDKNQHSLELQYLPRSPHLLGATAQMPQGLTKGNNSPDVMRWDRYQELFLVLWLHSWEALKVNKRHEEKASFLIGFQSERGSASGKDDKTCSI